jgi:hypothetical protein
VLTVCLTSELPTTRELPTYAQGIRTMIDRPKMVAFADFMVLPSIADSGLISNWVRSSRGSLCLLPFSEAAVPGICNINVDICCGRNQLDGDGFCHSAGFVPQDVDVVTSVDRRNPCLACTRTACSQDRCRRSPSPYLP